MKTSTKLIKIWKKDFDPNSIDDSNLTFPDTIDFLNLLYEAAKEKHGDKFDQSMIFLAIFLLRILENFQKKYTENLFSVLSSKDTTEAVLAGYRKELKEISMEKGSILEMEKNFVSLIFHFALRIFPYFLMRSTEQEAKWEKKELFLLGKSPEWITMMHLLLHRHQELFAEEMKDDDLLLSYFLRLGRELEISLFRPFELVGPLEDFGKVLEVEGFVSRNKELYFSQADMDAAMKNIAPNSSRY